jgi:fructokinase
MIPGKPDLLRPVFGIDLGGTKMEGVVLPSRQSTEPLARIRIPTEAGKGYDHVVEQIARLVDELEKSCGFRAASLGIGTPGTRDPETGLHKNSNTTCLNGRRFAGDLEARLERPVFIANDANCFALAETLLGSVRHSLPEARMVFGIIMGTGVGGGLVFDGRVWNGAHGIAGEWGHNFLDESGGLCYCGKSGCVETVLSGPALEAFYARLSGETRSLKSLSGHLHQPGSPAAHTFDRLYTQFGKAVAVLINILDPDAIVIGGGVGNLEGLYTEGVSRIVPHLFNPELRTRFLKPMLGDSAGVFGAAMLNPE